MRSASPISSVFNTLCKWQNLVVQKQFENLDIQCWEHTDSDLGVNRPFICLKAEPEAIAVLLAAINELSTALPPSHVTLTLKPCHRLNVRSRIRLIISPRNEHLREMSLTIAGDKSAFEFTSVGLNRFRESVVKWLDGVEDFSVHPSVRRKGSRDNQSGEVWFWTMMEP